MPNPKTCEPRDVEDALAYAQRQSQLWDGPIYVEPINGSDDALESARESWAVALGKWLKGTTLFRRLLMIFRQAEHDREDPLSWTDLVGRLASADLALKAITDDENRQRVIVSFFALVAYAQEFRSGRAFPLAPIQVQLWIRELRRLRRVVDVVPTFAWLDEPPSGKTCLPVFHCSECGESGWVARHDPSKDSFIRARGVDGMQVLNDPRKIYQDWFARGGHHSQYIVVISPWTDDNVTAEAESGTQ